MKNYLIGNKIKLVRFSDRYITPKYHSWLLDEDVNRYLHVGRVPVSYCDLNVPSANNNCIIKFAILSNIGLDSSCQLWQDNDFLHYIGTATLHNIDWFSRKAELGYMIGEKMYWGVGVATELVKLCTQYSFDKLNLNKLTAGVVDGNVGSEKALLKNGFQQYCIEKEDFYLDGKYLDAKKFHNFKQWQNIK